MTEDDAELVGDDMPTMGDVLGDDVLGEDDDVVGARRRVRLRTTALARRKTVVMPAKPAWRARLAPGVPMPGQGLEPLPMQPANGTGIFDSTTNNILFTARPQRPFRGERLLTSIRRSSGAQAVAVRAQTIIVGTAIQQAQLGTFDLDFFGPTAFGVRLSMVEAEPGIEIQIPAFVLPSVPVNESVILNIIILGRTVR